MAQALTGLRVLDFTHALAGPWCTAILQELGAEVIKIESGGGDMARILGPFTKGGEGYLFAAANRGKKSITLDIHTGEGNKIALDLAAKCDVLVENFAPGVMKRMGLSYADVVKVNPKIIYCSSSGFGQDGPGANRVAFDMVAQGMGGMMSVTGFPDSPPVRCGPAIADTATGLYAAIAILAALHHREKTGEGQSIDISMQDCVWALCVDVVGTCFLEGRPPRRMGNQHENGTPYNAYTAKDGTVILCIVTPDQFQKLCELMGRPDLCSDPASRTMAAREKNRARIEAAVVEWCKDRTVAEIIALMDAARVPAAPVLDLVQVSNDPQIKHRQMVVEVDQSLSGTVKMFGTVFKMSKTPGNPLNPWPVLGEHNSEIYGGLLGLSEEKISELMKKEVI